METIPEAFTEFLTDVWVKIENGLARLDQMTDTGKLRWQMEIERAQGIPLGGIPFSRDVYNSQLQTVLSDPRYVTFSNPHELIAVYHFLRLADLFEQAKHEQEHTNEAREDGFLEPVVGIMLLGRNPENADLIRIQYFSHPGPIPVGMSDAQVVEALRCIYNAPTDKSPGDRQALEQFPEVSIP